MGVSSFSSSSFWLSRRGLERSGGYRRRTYAQTLPLPRSMQKFSICGINPKLIVDMPTGVLVSLGE